MSSGMIAILIVGGLPLIAATVLLFFYERELKRARRGPED